MLPQPQRRIPWRGVWLGQERSWRLAPRLAPPMPQAPERWPRRRLRLAPGRNSARWAVRRSRSWRRLLGGWPARMLPQPQRRIPWRGVRLGRERSWRLAPRLAPSPMLRARGRGLQRGRRRVGWPGRAGRRLRWPARAPQSRAWRRPGRGAELRPSPYSAPGLRPAGWPRRMRRPQAPGPSGLEGWPARERDCRRLMQRRGGRRRRRRSRRRPAGSPPELALVRSSRREPSATAQGRTAACPSGRPGCRRGCPSAVRRRRAQTRPLPSRRRRRSGQLRRWRRNPIRPSGTP